MNQHIPIIPLPQQLVLNVPITRIMMEAKSDLSNRIEAITTDPEVDDFFIIISTKSEPHFQGRTIGPSIVSALAKTIVEQEGGLSTINRMQLAIIKAKELARQMLEEKVKAVH